MMRRQAFVIGAMGLTVACTVSPSSPADVAAEETGSSDSEALGDISGSTQAEGESSGGETPDPDPEKDPCASDGSFQPKRLVRLTFNQQLNTIGQLFGSELAQQLASDFDIEGDTFRTFPPLANPREGSVITDTQFQTGDNLAQSVARHVYDEFEALTGCGATPTDECARAYVLRTAESAFRRPLNADDEAGLLGVYASVQAEGGSVAEATRYAVYATLLSPHFTYRTEFGEDANTSGRLTPHELASALSYYLTDAAPDDELLEAARAGDLADAEGVRAQVARLLQTPEVRRNLESAMFAYFQLGTLRTVVIDPARAPNFDQGLRNSMMREAEAFISGVMATGTLADFLMRRESLVNERLAAVYGMEFPPPGAVLDEDGFAPATLPENRAGLLTLAGFLTAKSRPDQPSVVGRGLAVNAAFLCAQNPSFPETLVSEIEAIEEQQHEMSEREKADYRMNTSPCSTCHIGFDPYGVALDQFDIIGQYREVDDAGRTIDPSVALPPHAGGATVADAAEMADALAQTEAFTTCMAKNLLAYALAEGGTTTTSCATRAIVQGFATSDRTFDALVTEVATADAFVTRTASAGE